MANTKLTKEALAKASPERIESSKELLEYLKKFDKQMLELQQLKDDGFLPLRVTHNDTKANNLLFDHNDRPLCVIDLDTDTCTMLVNQIGRASCRERV